MKGGEKMYNFKSDFEGKLEGQAGWSRAAEDRRTLIVDARHIQEEDIIIYLTILHATFHQLINVSYHFSYSLTL